MAYGSVLKAGASALAILAVGLVIDVGCGGEESGVGKAKLPEGVRSQAIEHESCDEGGRKVEVLDANNDGKPDIKRVYAGGREICRITDLNHDGKPDMFEYYDQTGQLRRREADYDDNGIVNAIEHYENGKLVRMELDTTNQGRIDTWDYFDPGSGKRTKRERDATGDGRIDQWWTYEGDRVTIAMDRNGDGHPEPESTIVLGGSGGDLRAITDAGVASAAEAGASSPPPPPPPPSPAGSEPSPSAPPVTDAGTPGKPQRGGAKR
jgi:hypothetical protein